MGKIFYIMGKSASGKDTLYKRIREQMPSLQTVVPYTTRPIRSGEKDGRDYHFISQQELQDLEKAGRIIEMRTYQTVFGPWSYATVNDGQIDLEAGSCLLIGTLESYLSTRDYFGSEAMVPFLIYVEDGERLSRALAREKEQKEPKYAELCRRFLADEADFAPEKLQAAGIRTRYENQDADTCAERILAEIRHYAAN